MLIEPLRTGSNAIRRVTQWPWLGQVRGLNRACGLVGYPNVGKSSLFNAFAGSTLAAAENFPFCTVEPNVVKVGVPDDRLARLAELCSSQRTVPGQLEIRDIAGLIKGASSGAGMGNAFLSQIRGVNVVFHVVRCFSDQKIVHVEDPVNIDPVKEYESILEELIIADLEYASKRLPALRKKATTLPRPRCCRATRRSCNASRRAVLAGDHGAGALLR
ncbi:Ribosome-binding ATPase YchF [Durusdinium trenchii]|uniref:Ribosome-binding ATPase YchF n=1 Tax=Durusdinium trenchii TaxID=1381693 RepID=A0ABP0JKL7_9DINO